MTDYNECTDCEARWTGTVVEHCAACHQTFSSTQAGDAHRVGDHEFFIGPYRRRCLTEDEMLVRRTKAGKPVFDWTENVHGTRLWRTWRAEKASWFTSHLSSGASGDAPGAPVGGAPCASA